MNRNEIKSLLYGIAVGDAFGVPYEFKSRDAIKSILSQDMVGFGTHHQPAGTWSDDTSLALCLCDAIVPSFNLKKFSENVMNWYLEGEFSIGNTVFDIGNATKLGIEKLIQGEDPLFAGEIDECSNGNGSLMRVAPLIISSLESSVDIRRINAFHSSSITHGHNRSKIACWLLIEILRYLILGKEKDTAIDQAFLVVERWVVNQGFLDEWNHFRNCDSKISKKNVNEIKSSGYVIDSLESALFSFLTTDDYRSSILTAVSLGNDTDTIAAITGSMSGIFYGYGSIPKNWLEVLRGKKIIDGCIERACSY